MLTIADFHLEEVDPESVRRDMEKQISRHRGWYLLEGALFVVSGFLAVILPGVTALTVNILVGAMLAVTGAVQAVMFFRRREKWWRLFSGILSVIAGAIMLFYPLAGLAALVIVVGAFLVLEGVFEICMALIFRPFPRWRWMLASGIVTLALATLVLVWFPVAGALYIALAVGINMTLYGVSLLMLAGRTDRNAPQKRTT